MLTKIKQILTKPKNINLLEVFTVLLCIGVTLYAPETCAASIARPIVRVLTKLKVALLTIGKTTVVVSAVAAIILLGMGRPDWKWMGYITCGGALLTGFTYVSSFVMGI
jgi:hypothetical protein